MPVLTWPADLPPAFPIDTPEQPASGKIGWDPDQGPGRERTSQTARERRLEPPAFLMSESQVELFEAFYEQLGNGVDFFDWANPWPGAGVVRMKIVSYGPILWKTSPMMLGADMLVTGTSNPQRQARLPIVFERRPWEPFEIAASGTLALASRITTTGVDLAETGILAGDFVFFDADGKGKATPISVVTLPATLDLGIAYPVGPVGRSGAITIVKVARA